MYWYVTPLVPTGGEFFLGRVNVRSQQFTGETAGNCRKHDKRNKRGAKEKQLRVSGPFGLAGDPGSIQAVREMRF